jgi:ApaG protein
LGPWKGVPPGKAPLKTPSGVMRGTYQMVTADGDHFDVEIAPFALHEPYTIH